MSEQASTPEKSRVAQLNDEFRRAGPNENWIATVGALALSDFPGLIKAVQDFDDFTEGNDPFDEHDFGSIPWDNEKTFWKIDLRGPTLTYFMDGLSPECRRVLTIML